MFGISNTTLISYCLCYNILTLSNYYNYLPLSADPFPATNLFARRSILTVHTMARLGNQIWEYMSLFVVWKQHYKELQEYDVVPVIQLSMNDTLAEVFEELTISAGNMYQEPFSSNYQEWIVPHMDLVSFPRNKSVKWKLALEAYSARYKEIIAYGLENIREELRFKEKFVKDVNSKLAYLAKQLYPGEEDVTFIGMHYRGDDYVQHLEELYRENFKGTSDVNYYIKAMDYFKERFSNVLFILVSADEYWLEMNLHEIAGNGIGAVNPFKHDGSALDLTLLAHCNHSIINYGTFGVTAAFFANGTTIAFDLEVPLDPEGPTLAMGIAKVLPNQWLINGNS